MLTRMEPVLRCKDVEPVNLEVVCERHNNAGEVEDASIRLGGQEFNASSIDRDSSCLGLRRGDILANGVCRFMSPGTMKTRD
jgi:hypothetical protein